MNVKRLERGLLIVREFLVEKKVHEMLRHFHSTSLCARLASHL